MGKMKGKKDAAKGKSCGGAGDGSARSKHVKAKPRGMRWVNPYLTVSDVDAALAWYEKAFGFKTTLTLPGPDGKPVHAEMRHKKSTIMMGPESADGRSRAPGKQGAPVSMYCYCEDVDAIAASARAAGAQVLEEPQDQFWGDRTCFLVDPAGHQWMFATHKFDMGPGGPPTAGTHRTDDTEVMAPVGREPRVPATDGTAGASPSPPT